MYDCDSVKKIALPVCVLHILQKYSDAEHIMQMQEILEKLESEYLLKVDRRTVYQSVHELKNLGYGISDYSKNKKGYFLETRDLEKSEVRLLMDAVYSCQAISACQSKNLIGKLQKAFLSVYDRNQYKNLMLIRTNKKTQNTDVFTNIQQLDEALAKKKKVKFTYLEYGLNKKLKPRRPEKYTVNPHQLICTNEHYYLICRLEGCANLSLYRVDLIKDLEVTDDLAYSDLAPRELQSAENKTVYAWCGKEETVTLRCKRLSLGHVIDKFGDDVTIIPEGKDFFIATFKVAPVGVSFWALQYLPYVEVLAPEWLRQEVIQSIKDNPYTESMK